MNALSFTFTKEQYVASEDILGDIEKTTPASRLLLGDVGSGKTVVAALALFAASRAGYGSLLLAPTELLAKQHATTLLSLLHPLGVRVQLLTGSTTTAAKKQLAQQAKNGSIDVLVGTHALLSNSITLKNLGLAVIDEQHRFGVTQRALIAKEKTPHILSLSATPIPRTLALTIFGDHDISFIRSLPPGRQPITTRMVQSTKRKECYAWLENQVAKGRQAFIVCPRIDGDDDTSDAAQKSVRKEFVRVRDEVFGGRLRVGLLHGRMKAKEKDAVMQEMAEGTLDILVATTVIEVGIDVPNASVMIIESADRYGLAQLHQLRGRVGRGAHTSFCFLFMSSEEIAELAHARLQLLTETTSGFDLADFDLKSRGPGDVFGTRQSGVPDLRIARLTDTELIEKSRTAARNLLKEDPHLAAHPAISAYLAQREESSLRQASKAKSAKKKKT